ncbi:hypothetical protein BDR22DRAFT_855416 [Usnea florida]
MGSRRDVAFFSLSFLFFCSSKVHGKVKRWKDGFWISFFTFIPSAIVDLRLVYLVI